MNPGRNALVLCFFLHLYLPLTASYSIRGKVNLTEQWQPRIFMAAIEKLSDYYRASPDLIVNMALIDAEGHFELSGDNLPAEFRFYRLYLMKKQNDEFDACLYVGGDDHNFVHVVANNHSELELIATAGYQSPFGNYEVSGDLNNHLMRDLARIVYPSFYFYQIKFPTELRFSEAKLHTDLKTFIDTCQSPIVSLAAVNNTDFDEYFEQDQAFYQRFGERLLRELPASVYTGNYLRRLRYYANEEAPAAVPGWTWGVWLLLLGGLVVLTSQNARLRSQLRKSASLNAKVNSDHYQKEIDQKLTQKEKEILMLIGRGKSNKEIAGELFVELSTVKTHINRIYSKLHLKDRREAAQVGKAYTPV